MLQVHITDACNLHCKHCYLHDAQRRFMAFEDFSLLLEQFDELLRRVTGAEGAAYCGQVTITGGEPLLHPDFERFAFVAAQRGFRFAVLTNGHFITERTAALLADAKFVQVSLDGDKRRHDAVRGPGDFEQVIGAIRTLAASGARPIVSFTAHAGNYTSLPAAAKAARRAGAVKFWSDRYLPIGEDPELAALDGRQTGEYLATLARASCKAGSIVTCNRALQFSCGGAPYSCSAGGTLLAVDETCTVYPCRRLPLPCGDFRQEPLSALYESSPVLASLRAFNAPEQCCECPDVTTCKGGSRCMAQAVAGDWRLRDPGCARACGQS